MQHTIVTPEATSQPNLRKLARALIALARREQAEGPKASNGGSMEQPGEKA